MHTLLQPVCNNKLLVPSQIVAFRDVGRAVVLISAFHIHFIHAPSDDKFFLTQNMEANK
jgi:hypothetical protein